MGFTLHPPNDSQDRSTTLLCALRFALYLAGYQGPIQADDAGGRVGDYYERYPVLTVVFDAGPLITACKFEAQGKLVIDHMLSGCRIVIAPSVEEEVAVLGAGYSDGVVAGERIVQGGIQVMAVVERKWARHLTDYALGNGERDSIELCRQMEEVEALVTDDYLAFVAATRLGLRAWMLPDLAVELVERGSLTAEVTEAVLEAIRSRYRMGVIEHSLVRLQEVKKGVESRGADQGRNSAAAALSAF